MYLCVLSSGDLDVCKEVAFGPILSHVLEQVPAAFDIKSEVLNSDIKSSNYSRGRCFNQYMYIY